MVFGKLFSDFAWKEVKKNMLDGWGNAATELMEMVAETATDTFYDLVIDRSVPQEVIDARARLQAANERLQGNVQETIEQQAADRAIEQQVAEPVDVGTEIPKTLERNVSEIMHENPDEFPGLAGTFDMHDEDDLEEVLQRLKDPAIEKEMAAEPPFVRDHLTWLKRETVEKLGGDFGGDAPLWDELAAQAHKFSKFGRGGETPAGADLIDPYGEYLEMASLNSDLEDGEFEQGVGETPEEEFARLEREAEMELGGPEVPLDLGVPGSV